MWCVSQETEFWKLQKKKKKGETFAIMKSAVTDRPFYSPSTIVSYLEEYWLDNGGNILWSVGVFNSLISMFFSLLTLNTFSLLFIKSETPFPLIFFF